MTVPSSVLVITMSLSAAATGAPEWRTLFDFADSGSAEDWQTVNDGVMGGRSTGQFAFTQDGSLRFSGTLSLENNGGFASVRTRPAELPLQLGQTIVARVRGDGREYSLNLYVPRQRTAFSWRMPFRTVKGEWIEVAFPLDEFVATSFGRPVRGLSLNPADVNGLGFLLGDKQPGPFTLGVDWIRVGDGTSAAPTDSTVVCEGTYPHHLQGVCKDGEAIYWSFTTRLVKTDLAGRVLKQIPVANHHGDLCCHDGRLFCAVNLGDFNNPDGHADSWVYVYDAETLDELARHETPEVQYGAGGVGVREGRFYLVGGLPPGIEENFVYEYDREFQFVRQHTVASGSTLMGIQTAAFAHDRWWFGCYGDPKVLLVTDAQFRMIGRCEFDCSLGIAGLPDGRLLVAGGTCREGVGCTGRVRPAVPAADSGLRFTADPDDSEDAAAN